MSKKELLTHSRMQSFKHCRQKHHLEYNIGMRKTTSAKPLRMGHAGHEGLDVFKKTADIAAAIEAVNKEYADCPPGFEELDWEYERETVETLIAGYGWRWEDQPLTMISSEESFRFPLINPATGKATPLFDRGGKIDGIIEMDGRKLVLEHKFISDDIDPSSDYWRRLQIDQQCTNYTDAGRQLGHNPSGILYDVIRKPTIRPSMIPFLDDDGLKQVHDENGVRIRNKSIKPKKTCKVCEGTGVVPMSLEIIENTPCPCTLGKWRQTADKERGYVIHARPMTPTEWSNKLLKDIGERPEWYYQRVEIARLQDDIDEFLSETWDVQKSIRDAQKNNAHYKTVNLGSCSFCPFFNLCASKHEFDGVAPEGFEILEFVHPELGDGGLSDVPVPSAVK